MQNAWQIIKKGKKMEKKIRIIEVLKMFVCTYIHRHTSTCIKIRGNGGDVI